MLKGIGWLAYHTMSLFGREVHLSHHKMKEVTALNWGIDISRARNELGFQPKYDLHTGIAQTLTTQPNKKAQDAHIETMVKS